MVYWVIDASKSRKRPHDKNSKRLRLGLGEKKCDAECLAKTLAGTSKGILAYTPKTIGHQASVAATGSSGVVLRTA